MILFKSKYLFYLIGFYSNPLGVHISSSPLIFLSGPKQPSLGEIREKLGILDSQNAEFGRGIAMKINMIIGTEVGNY